MIQECFICGQNITALGTVRWDACGGDSYYTCERHNCSLYLYCETCNEALEIVSAGDQVRRLSPVGEPSCGCRFIGEYCVEYHEEACDYTEDDFEENNNFPIHNYGYKPDAIFHGDGPRFYGLELEVDDTDSQELSPSDAANHLITSLSQEESLFYTKDDGSLINGFEVVTHPCSLRFHEKEFPWEEITQAVLARGFRSHTTTTCGLHIHVSRNSLGKTRTTRDIVLSKLMLLYWRHWKEIKAFSRRKEAQVSRWAGLNYISGGATKVSKVALEGAKHGRGKYCAINTDNIPTIEFRVFRGSLVPQTILAAIQFTDVLIDLAMSHGTGWVVKSTWVDILAACENAKHPELAAYLASLRIDNPTFKETPTCV